MPFNHVERGGCGILGFVLKGIARSKLVGGVVPLKDMTVSKGSNAVRWRG